MVHHIGTQNNGTPQMTKKTAKRRPGWALSEALKEPATGKKF